MILETVLFLISFMIAYLLTNRVLNISLDRKLYDIPDQRSSHYIPKPRLGGIAIVMTFYLASVILLFTGNEIFPSARTAAGIYSAGFIVAATGFVDDIRGLDARFKLVVQFAAATIAILSGAVLTQFRMPFVGSVEFGILSIPLTYLWIIGIMNFYNFVDGIDGLAAGVGVIGSIFLIFMARSSALPGLALLYAILAGSGFGFLRYNFPPARIFMGDTGSTFLGFMFASLAVLSNQNGVPAFVTVLVFGSVLADAFLTLFRRILNRERILSPHRTHYYQRLTSIGFSHKQVTLLEYFITASLGVSAFFFMTGDRIFITVFSVFWFLFFLLVLIKIRSMEKGKSLFWEGRTVFIALADFLLIGASYVLSYYLRLNFSFPEAETSSMLVSLPIVLIIRTIVFYYSGLYRAVWKYVTFDDLISIVKAVSFSSLIIIVLFTMFFRFEAFPRSVFLIDLFILTVFISGSRVVTRWFHDLPKHESISARRVAIVGTGVTPEAVLQKIKRSHGLKPVGYIDERSRMQGRLVGGLRVLGTLEDAPAIVSDYRVDEFIMMDSYLDRIPGSLLDRVREAGGDIHVISGPDDIDEDHFTGFEKFPFRDRSVLLISTGPLCRYAGSVLARTSLLVISAESPGMKNQGGRAGEKVLNYYGAAESARLLGAVIEEHDIDYVIFEYTTEFTKFENSFSAYFNALYRPLKRVAETVAKSGGAELVILSGAETGSGRIADAACSIAEAAALEEFAECPRRIHIIRSGNDRSPGSYREALLEIDESAGGFLRRGASSEGLYGMDTEEIMRVCHPYISKLETAGAAGDYERAGAVIEEAAREAE